MIQELQKLRGVAILMVLFTHFESLVPWIQPWWLKYCYPWSGVDLFFCISGFVIANRLKKDPHHINSIGGFYCRRFFRTFPMAILSITLYFITSKLIDHPGLTSPNISGMYLSVIGVVTATYNLLYVLFQLPSFTGPFWSLALEEQFYLSYPILLLLIKDENKRIFLSLALLIGVMSFDRRLGTLGWFFRIDPILGGVLLHHLVTKFQFQTYPSTHKWLTYVALFFLCILPRYMDSKFLITALAITSTYLVWIASLDRGFLLPAPKVVDKVLYWLGDRAFSIYLLHALNYAITHYFLFKVLGPQYQSIEHVTILSVVMFVILLFFSCTLSYRYVEIPMIAKGKKIANRLIMNK